MKFSMTEQEKSDCLIEVTAWKCLSVRYNISTYLSVLEMWLFELTIQERQPASQGYWQV